MADNERMVKVSEVEGHPVYFDTVEGKLYGEVRGVTVEHKTYSTLRKLMLEQHFKTLNAVPVLLVSVPERVRSYGTVPQPQAVQAVSVQEHVHGPRLIVTHGGAFEMGSYAAVPLADAEAVTAVRDKLDAFQAEETAEEERHQEAMKEIGTRVQEYAQALALAFPMTAVAEGLPSFKSENDRLAYIRR